MSIETSTIETSIEVEAAKTEWCDLIAAARVSDDRALGAIAGELYGYLFSRGEPEPWRASAGEVRSLGHRSAEFRGGATVVCHVRWID